MDFIYSYLLESSASLVLLYLIYFLFLRRDTFFTVNRFYLAGSIIFSLILPIFKWNINLNEVNASYVFLLDTIVITPDQVEATINSNLSLITILTVIYLTGASLFFVRFALQIFQVLRLVSKYKITRRQGLRLVFINRNYQPFSFFRIIFVPESLKEAENLPQIIEHEKVHVDQNHSIDLILLEILTVAQWFNPIIWLYRRSMKSIHEYLADEGVIVRGFDKTNYQELLLGQTLGIQVNDLINNFNHSLLKNRIIMMTKQRSGTFSGWKAALSIPIALGMILIFTLSVNTESAKEGLGLMQIASANGKALPIEIQENYLPQHDTAGKKAGKEPAYEMVKTMPEFDGGHNALVSYLISNIHYPDEAKKNNITGTVIVTFIVEKTGKINHVKILKGVDPLLDAEALRVVSTMPNWKPGRNDEGKAVNVIFNLPIKFSLDAKKAEEKP